MVTKLRSTGGILWAEAREAKPFSVPSPVLTTKEQFCVPNAFKISHRTFMRGETCV